MSEPLPFRGPRADKEPKVVIDTKEYRKLQARSLFLKALEFAGVDNWTGYEFVHEMLFDLCDGNQEEIDAVYNNK